MLRKKNNNPDLIYSIQPVNEVDLFYWPWARKVTKNSNWKNTDMKWNQTKYATVPSTRGPRGVHVCIDKSVCQSPSSTQIGNRLWQHQQALEQRNSSSREARLCKPTPAHQCSDSACDSLWRTRAWTSWRVDFNAPFNTHSSVLSEAAFEVIRSTGIRLKELSYLNRSHTQTQP